MSGFFAQCISGFLTDSFDIIILHFGGFQGGCRLNRTFGWASVAEVEILRMQTNYCRPVLQTFATVLTKNN